MYRPNPSIKNDRDSGSIQFNEKHYPLLKDRARYLVLYGGTDSGKSHFAGQKLFDRTLKERNHRFLLLRKVQRTIRHSQFYLIKDIVYRAHIDHRFKFHASTLEIEGPNNNLFLGAGLDEPLKLKSMHGITGIWIEEPSELTRDDFDIADLLLRQLGEFYNQIMLTFNPMKMTHFTYQLFFGPNRLKDVSVHHFVYKNNAFRNPVNDARYEAFTGEMARIYQKGEWGEISDPDQLIPFDWVQKAYLTEPIEGHKKMGVDVARYGTDKSVIAIVNGNALEKITAYEDLSLDRLADFVKIGLLDERIPSDYCGIDAVGLGGGVVDMLKKEHFPVIEIIGGAKPMDGIFAFEFNNLRSQMWWALREAFRKEEIHLAFKDLDLVADLTTPRYTYDHEKKIAVESKDSMVLRLHRSPDRGDALAYAWFVDKIKSTFKARVTIL